MRKGPLGGNFERLNVQSFSGRVTVPSHAEQATIA
jgi:hypothetical protein